MLVRHVAPGSPAANPAYGSMSSPGSFAANLTSL